MSLVVISCNEERNIVRCLKSASWVDEILLVDSGSGDDTVRLAKQLGARVIQTHWRGYGEQKKFAAEQAQHDWILSLDADEALSAELSQSLQSLRDSLDPETGYEFPRKSFFMGRWILHGGWFPDAQLRLFHRKHSQWMPASVHERVLAKRTQRIKEPLEHFVFLNLAAQVDANNRYSTLQAKNHVERGQRFSWYKLLVKPWVKFIECYLFKRGFLDGFPGFVIAVGAAHSVFIRWVKVRELEQML